MRMMRFHMQAARADRTGYYYTRWDQATPIVADVETKQQAINDAAAALGEAGPGRYWLFQVDRVTPACNCKVGKP